MFSPPFNKNPAAPFYFFNRRTRRWQQLKVKLGKTDSPVIVGSFLLTVLTVLWYCLILSLSGCCLLGSHDSLLTSLSFSGSDRAGRHARTDSTPLHSRAPPGSLSPTGCQAELSRQVLMSVCSTGLAGSGRAWLYHSQSFYHLVLVLWVFILLLAFNQ